jgi:hypothetical protein
MWNIYRCESCKLHLIYEEMELHLCLSVKDTRFEEDTKWVFDGKIWYPLKLTKKTIQSNEKLHGEDSNGEVPPPEIPTFSFCMV